VSSNKNKTFLVSGSFVVKANNKRDAELAVRRARVTGTTVVGGGFEVSRIPAAEADSFLSQSN